MAENDFGIAIIGMAGRFPQADTVQAFWENLLASRECISFYSDEELLAYGVPLEWLVDVKAANEDSLLDLTDHLPGEAAPRDAVSCVPRPYSSVGRATDF